MSRNKWLVGGALVLAATLGAAQAQAHTQVQWSVSVGAPGLGAVLAGPAPVYVAPVYATPAYGAPVYSAPVYGGHRAPVYRGGYRQSSRWDADGDGVPNRYDRVYNPRWDADGDGVPNRYDRVYNPRWDRDGDGIPNRYDRRWGHGG